MGNFLELAVKPAKPADENAEIITAYLSEYPFDVFEYEDGFVKAFGAEINFDGDFEILKETIAPFIEGEITTRIIIKENWNELWEKNYFEPVTIDNRIHIRAAFHPALEGNIKEIIIQPKMSFGTGHHSTTQLMVSLMLKFEPIFKEAKILDMGSGTGVLAIVAEILKSKQIDAVDIEDWSAENIAENAEINECKTIQAYCGNVEFIKSAGNNAYDVILANIHKQVLLDDTVAYSSALKSGGVLFLSGFYPADLADINANCRRYDMEFVESQTLGQWCASVYKKK